MTTDTRPVQPVLHRLSRTRFLVASRSRDGLTHHVDTLHLTCSCEAGQRHIRCWHLVAALQAEFWLHVETDAPGPP